MVEEWRTMKNNQTIIKRKFKEDRPKSELSCRNRRMKKQNKTGRFLFSFADERRNNQIKKNKNGEAFGTML